MQFRRLALTHPEVIESGHMGHPDFRFRGKIFATLGVPDSDWGMVKLTPDQQRMFCQADEPGFQPCQGSWGRQGCTYVQLSKAKSAVVKSAILLAVENIAAAPAIKKSSTSPKRGAKRKPNQT